MTFRRLAAALIATGALFTGGWVANAQAADTGSCQRAVRLADKMADAADLKIAKIAEFAGAVRTGKNTRTLIPEVEASAIKYEDLRRDFDAAAAGC